MIRLGAITLGESSESATTEVLAPGRAMRLGDVPAGGVIGTFDRGQYVRFLRTSSVTTAQDHVAVVGLGPFPDDDQPARVQGPTTYLWPTDVDVIYEEQTSIVPKHDSVIDPTTARHVPLGAIIFSQTGQICIQTRTPRAGRALIDLSNGELVRDEHATAPYEYYVLVAPDEVQKKRVIFDSSKQASAISTAA